MHSIYIFILYKNDMRVGINTLILYFEIVTILINWEILK